MAGERPMLKTPTVLPGYRPSMAVKGLFQRKCLFLTVLLGLAGSCGRTDLPGEPPVASPRFDPAAVNGERALADVGDFVGLGPRVSGTAGAEGAARYLAQRLTAIGIEPIVDEFSDDTPDGQVRFRNVLGEIPGTDDRTIIVASHYDTKDGISPDFAGANDSGSSTGLLLELGRVFRSASPRGPSILLAFLDGEECKRHYADNDGLHGSRWLAKTLVQNRRAGNVIAVIVLDMIGDANLNVTIPRNCTSRLATLVLDAARAQGVRHAFGLSPGRGIVLDDHVPFVAAGMPAIDLIDFTFGSAPGLNDYWHTPRDTMDKLSAESLATVGRVVVQAINVLSAAPAKPARP